MANAGTTSSPQPGQGGKPVPDQSPAEQPQPDPPDKGKDQKRWPPDSIPNPMPGVDPQQTPGIDRLDNGSPARALRTRPHGRQAAGHGATFF